MIRYDMIYRRSSPFGLLPANLSGERAAARWWRLRRTRWPMDGDLLSWRDDVRWPAVAATLRGRGRVCAAQVGRTRLHRMASVVERNNTVRGIHVIFHSNGSGVCLFLVYSYTGAALTFDSHTGRGPVSFSRVFIGGGFFFTKNARLRLAPRSVLFLGILFIVRVCKGGCRQAGSRERSERDPCASVASAKARKKRAFF